MQNDLISRVYDLILDEKTPNDEKSKLIEFKNSVENGAEGRNLFWIKKKKE